MSKFPYIEIESKLAELEKHSSQESYLENRQIKLLTRKCERERETRREKMPYCPTCKKEYPLGTTICVDCNVSLIDNKAADLVSLVSLNNKEQAEVEQKPPADYPVE